jgi:GTPase
MATVLRAPSATLAPFLYPFTSGELVRATRCAKQLVLSHRHRQQRVHNISTTLRHETSNPQIHPNPTQGSHLVHDGDPSTHEHDEHTHLNPRPDSYAQTPFLDSCTVTVQAGSGGHGCVSFLREKFIAEGPANGGDGGSGGNIYIQAVRGETSLHKLARRREIKAGRGKNGMGSSCGGQRGQDVCIEVPIGTVVREVERYDAVAKEEEAWWEEEKKRKRKSKVLDSDWDAVKKDKWLLYAGAKPWTVFAEEIPELPRPRRSNLTALMPQEPIKLDLDEPMERPMLLAAGAMGGFGNPHFVSRDIARPKFATKGDGGMSITLHLELKLLADVGLVGLPNAGKSTLLRSLSNSRARVGNWAFTTLQPNIGTVVLDDYKSRPTLRRTNTKGGFRTKFTIADIPGLIEDAHLNKGLGLDFLRHVERAAVLAFVIDLNAGDAVQALRALWKEVAEYEALRGRRINLESETRIIEWTPMWEAISPMHETDGRQNRTELFQPKKSRELPALNLPPMSSKPWFVVATKADLPETQANFAALQSYLQGVEQGVLEHPSGIQHAWKRRIEALPVSAIRGEGVERIPGLVLDLLNE